MPVLRNDDMMDVPDVNSASIRARCCVECSELRWRTAICQATCQHAPRTTVARNSVRRTAFNRNTCEAEDSEGIPF